MCVARGPLFTVLEEIPLGGGAARVAESAEKGQWKGATPLLVACYRKLQRSLLAIAKENGHAAVVALLEEHQK